MSDVPTSTHSTSRRNHHHHHHHGQHHAQHRHRGQPSRSSLRSSASGLSRPETPLILSSFKPNIIPSISQPTPEEIQRDVDIVFHSMGLDSAMSPIRHQQQHFQPYVNQEQEEEED